MGAMKDRWVLSIAFANMLAYNPWDIDGCGYCLVGVGTMGATVV